MRGTHLLLGDLVAFRRDRGRSAGRLPRRAGRRGASPDQDPGVRPEASRRRPSRVHRPRAVRQGGADDERAGDAYRGRSVLTTEDDEHRDARHHAQPAFRRASIMAIGDTVVRGVDRMLDGWEDGAEIDLPTEVNRLAREHHQLRVRHRERARALATRGGLGRAASLTGSRSRRPRPAARVPAAGPDARAGGV